MQSFAKEDYVAMTVLYYFSIVIVECHVMSALPISDADSYITSFNKIHFFVILKFTMWLNLSD